MAAELSPGVLRLLEEPNFAYVATVMRSGDPQVTPVWIDTDGTHVIFNTATGRTKTRNMERNAQVAVAISDRNNPYAYAQIRGRVVEVTKEGANAHIDKMAKKYTGRDEYGAHRAGEERLIIKILPDRVQAQGLS